jgi:hypothetical protein
MEEIDLLERTVVLSQASTLNAGLLFRSEFGVERLVQLSTEINPKVKERLDKLRNLMVE